VKHEPIHVGAYSFCRHHEPICSFLRGAQFQDEIDDAATRGDSCAHIDDRIFHDDILQHAKPTCFEELTVFHLLSYTGKKGYENGIGAVGRGKDGGE
jgi:hypothetical protein